MGPWMTRYLAVRCLKGVVCVVVLGPAGEEHYGYMGAHV